MANKAKYLFVFDIETIPDNEVAKFLTKCESTDIIEQRQALTNYHLEITEGKNSFLRQPFHKVVAVSYALFNITHTPDGEYYSLRYLRSGGSETNYNEKTLIEGFFASLKKYSPRLVTFNGRTFDIPVLKYRAMKYGIDCKPFYVTDFNKNYQYRYCSEYNCDLLDVLSDFGASARIKLNEVCSILGIPGKFGIDGSDVTSLYDKGDIKSIRDYCETDVLNTYLVYLRYALHTGKVSKEGYNNSIKEIIEYINNNDEKHLKEFKLAWEKDSEKNMLLE